MTACLPGCLCERMGFEVDPENLKEKASERG